MIFWLLSLERMQAVHWTGGQQTAGNSLENFQNKKRAFSGERVNGRNDMQGILREAAGIFVS